MKNIQKQFLDGIGKKALVLLEAFPFFFTGKVKAAGKDFAVIVTEFGLPIQLLNKPFIVNFDTINAFFVEDGENQIPVANGFNGAVSNLGSTAIKTMNKNSVKNTCCGNSLRENNDEFSEFEESEFTEIEVEDDEI